MESKYTIGTWKAVFENGRWEVRSSESGMVASIEKGGQDEPNARLIAASPMMFEALSGLVQLIGDEDLPDNGELSGAAICDLARSAIAIATGDEKWPFS
ncbi:hypothetical protein ACFLUZ_01830 [Chloroflexota bacterium]